MRRALLSVVVAVAGAAAVSAAGWAFQTVALPVPERADRVAADAEAWLHDYRLSIDVFHAEDHRFTGACLRGWYARPYPLGRHLGQRRPLMYGSALVVSSGPMVLASAKGRIWLALGHRRTGLPAFLAVAVGCTGSLASALTTAVQSGRDLHLERAYAANQPALALELHLHDERLTLYLSPRGYRPLVVLGAVRGRIAVARLYLTHEAPAQGAMFRRLVRPHGIPLP